MVHKGSLQYWQKRRARRRLPRLRSAPVYLKAPSITNMVAFKAGMSHISMTDDSESPSKNTEISRPCTFIEIPEVQVYGARFYSKNGNSTYRQTATEVHSKEHMEKHKTKAKKVHDLAALKAKISEFTDVTALLVAYVKGTPVGQHHKVRFESALGGGSVEEKYNFIVANIGKAIKPSDVFKPGEFIDVSSVSKGKGWQGTIKRFGTARLYHKATQKTRHVGTLGPFTPGKVLFTVPQAGQLGFNYRTEYNKRILKIGTKEESKSMNPKAGFQNYGNIDNDFIVLDGSIPGPAKRLIRIRKSVTNRNQKGIKEPKLTYMAVNG